MIENGYIDALQIHETDGYGLNRFNIGSPEPRASTANRPTAHGALDVADYYGPRLFDVGGEVWGDTYAEFWQRVDALKGALQLGTTHVLKFTREGLGYAERAIVRVASAVDMPLEGSATFVPWGVSLLAADPRIYSDTLSSGNYDPTAGSSGAGLVFPLTFPLDFGGSGTSQLSVSNAGNIATPATFTITGPVTNPIVDNDTTGESITTTGLALTASDVLVVDTQARTAKLGTTNRPDFIDASNTAWFDLEPGINLLRLRGSGMAASQTDLAVSFRDARI